MVWRNGKNTLPRPQSAKPFEEQILQFLGGELPVMTALCAKETHGNKPPSEPQPAGNG